MKLRLVLRNVLNTARAVLAGVFDEEPYIRFLEREQLRNSREAYARFLEESRATRERRPRCC